MIRTPRRESCSPIAPSIAIPAVFSKGQDDLGRVGGDECRRPPAKSEITIVVESLPLELIELIELIELLTPIARDPAMLLDIDALTKKEIGRASCRERVSMAVEE